MIGLQATVSDALLVLGIAACGIAAVSFSAAARLVDGEEADKAQSGGVTMGAVGLIALALAVALRLP